jgi:hypothetical protein
MSRAVVAVNVLLTLRRAYRLRPPSLEQVGLDGIPEEAASTTQPSG